MTTERIAYLEALVAQQADALKTCRSDWANGCYGTMSEKDYDSEKVSAAISASAETVQAFRDKLTAEAEARGAVKAHQRYTVTGALHKDVFYAYPPFPEGSKLLFDRATTKKEG